MEVEQEVLCSECHACNPEQSSLRQWQPPAKKGEEISQTLYQLNSSPCVLHQRKSHLDSKQHSGRYGTA
jgi:hypothetical protein